ncbi:DUF445 family protein [Alkalispirochaeta sphaeroplastigenens]|uniref:DUF445 family protein n=1 Tax=Alkalispirochaeta sphaeroplastigenens TaxID=1187066 RepID=UPI0011AECF81|nr:DUF445 family protein [Alkalispirochaeta sphaeroplastigenens]
MIATIFPWALPVVLGAAIGYLTNSLAIRMLFRPLRPVMVWKIPLPFTPGVIPRQRGELARSIARMVSRDLLSREVLDQRFSAGSFRSGLEGALSRGVGALSSMPLVRVTEKIRAEQLLRQLDNRAMEFLEGDAGRSLRENLARRAARCLSARAADIAPLLLKEFSGVKPLERISPERAGLLVDACWPDVARAAEALLQRQEVRHELARRVEGLLSFALDQLNPLQRLLVVTVQYDRQLAEMTPLLVERIIGETQSFVESGACREMAKGALIRWVEEHRGSTGRDLLPGDSGAEVFLVLGESLEEALGDSDRLASCLERHLQALPGRVARPDPVAGRETPWVRALLAWIGRRGQVPLGEVFPVLHRRERLISRWGARRIQGLLRSVTREILDHLDVEELVVSRIDSLEVERVESLLMDIIRRHLRWINVFGAFLGAVIGASQVLLRLMEVV